MADAITTKNITSVDEVQSVDNTDKVFVNDNGSFKQISVSNLMKQAPSGVTEETDPTVSEWAKQPTKPSYTADEVGALPVGTKIPTKTSDLTNDSGYLTQIPEEYVTETELGQKGYITEDDIPEKLPSPGTLTFTGAVNDTYDGSTNKTINIPTGGGEGGTSDYNALANKPKLNGVEIAGNKTSADYKIVSSEQGIENNGKFLGVSVDGNVTPVDKPTYTADEVGARPDTWTPSAEDVGALPNDTEIPSKTSDLENDSGFITNSDIPEKLPNPQKIIFTGAVSAEYDGSTQQTINIPTGGGSDPYTLPIMSSTQLGGGKAVSKTDEDVPVAVDTETGQLFVPAYPSGGGNGVSGWVKVGSVTSETDGETLTISGIGSATKIKVVLKAAAELDNTGLRFYFGNNPYQNYLLMGSSVSGDFGYTIFEMEITNIDGVNILNVPFIAFPKDVTSANANVSSLSKYQGFVGVMEIDSFDTFSVTSANSQLKSGCIMEVYKWQ